MPRPKIITLSKELYEDYLNDEECFGNKDLDVGYSAEAECCQPDQCPDTELCKSICLPIFEALKAGKEPNIKVVCEGAESEPVEEPSNAPEAPANDTDDWSRESVLAHVLDTCADAGYKPEVTSTGTRDKVFIGEDDVFIVTKKALKINRLENGDKLGLDESYWKVDNKGIQIEYDNDISFSEVATKALAVLYGAIAVTESKAPADNLFDAAEETTEPEVPKKGIITPNKGNAVAQSDLEFAPNELDKGEVTKSLQIISYSNGYNEIRITSKASVEDILGKVKIILG